MQHHAYNINDVIQAGNLYFGPIITSPPNWVLLNGDFPFWCCSSFAMTNITSVPMGEKPANRAIGIVVALVGVIELCNIQLFVGIILIIAGIALAFLVKPSYIVRIGSTGGESDALIANDKDYIQKIVNAVNEAIIKHG